MKLAFLAAGLFAVAAAIAVPLAMQAETLLASQNDPAAIADIGLDKAFNRAVAVREIEAALAVDDAELANSFLELAGDRRIEVPAALVEQVRTAIERANSTGA